MQTVQRMWEGQPSLTEQGEDIQGMIRLGVRKLRPSARYSYVVWTSKNCEPVVREWAGTNCGFWSAELAADMFF